MKAVSWSVMSNNTWNIGATSWIGKLSCRTHRLLMTYRKQCSTAGPFGSQATGCLSFQAQSRISQLTIWLIKSRNGTWILWRSEWDRAYHWQGHRLVASCMRGTYMLSVAIVRIVYQQPRCIDLILYWNDGQNSHRCVNIELILVLLSIKTISMHLGGSRRKIITSRLDWVHGRALIWIILN